MKNSVGTYIMNSEDSFKNPFSDYNANVMDTKKILDYWCSPFAFSKSAPISERDIYHDNMPIVFMGGRGTGKTMFLKYFSYYTQRDEAIREKTNCSCNAILSFLKSRGGIGFYLRFDGPILRSFEGKGVEPEKWDAIFTQYFELQVCKAYIEVIMDLVKREQLNRQEINDKFVPAVSKKLGQEDRQIGKIEDVVSIVEDALDEVTSFRARIAFSDIKFHPSKAYASQDLSFGVADIARQTINEFKDINFVILIDEYENYHKRQQTIINTLLKFVKPGMTFRIGMRLEGFRTFETISPNEFIKEGRDYSKYVFEDILGKDKEYRDFLMNVARKRLDTISTFRENNLLDISQFLGKEEDLEVEARNLVEKAENPLKHFDLLNSVPGTRSSDEIQKIIAKPDNPLLEIMNILWVMRGNDPTEVKKAMEGYLRKGAKDPIIKKYERDYIDKYKLSLMFLLASAYRKRKMYYSFNTFCFLSSGIIGNFIELCRRSFQYAYFEDRDGLFNQGTISSNLQDRAARDLANSELEMIKRIQNYGHNLYLFTKNVGNLFGEYHRDPFVRYPETNQFAVDVSSIEDSALVSMFKAALEWSIIQKKPTLQQLTPGSTRTDIYTLNRIFSPVFDLTYRTRGGHSLEFEAEYLTSLMKEDNIKPRLNLKKKGKTGEGLQQPLDLK